MQMKGSQWLAGVLNKHCVSYGPITVVPAAGCAIKSLWQLPARALSFLVPRLGNA